MIRLSKATMGNIKQNITIGLGLKAVFFPVTTVVSITRLWPALLGRYRHDVLVTANAMRLLRWKDGHRVGRLLQIGRAPAQVPGGWPSPDGNVSVQGSLLALHHMP